MERKLKFLLPEGDCRIILSKSISLSTEEVDFLPILINLKIVKVPYLKFSMHNLALNNQLEKFEWQLPCETKTFSIMVKCNFSNLLIILMTMTLNFKFWVITGNVVCNISNILQNEYSSSRLVWIQASKWYDEQHLINSFP